MTTEPRSWAHRLGEDLGQGTLSDALLTVLTLFLLVEPLAGRLTASVMGLELRTPLFMTVLPAWLALSGWRVAHRHWGTNKSKGVQQWAWTYRYGLSCGLLVLCGLSLRLWGIEFGLPVITHPDESSVAGIAISMLRSGWIDPKWYIYPTFFMNFLLPAFGLYYVAGKGDGLWNSLGEIGDFDPGFYLLARYHTAILGTLTIVAAYYLAVAAFPGIRGRRAGVVAAALVTFSFIHVRDSHYAVTDVPTGLMVTLAMIAIVNVFSKCRLRDSLAAGLLCGLAGSTKYTALPVLAPLAIAHLLGRPPRAWLDRRLWIAGAATVAGFVMGSPYSVLNWSFFLEDLGWLNTYSGSVSLADTQQKFLHVVGYTQGNGLGLIAFGFLVVALVRAIHRRSDATLLLALLLLAAMPQMTHTTHRFFPRFLVPLVPAAGVLIAVLVDEFSHGVSQRLRRRVPALGVTAILTLAMVWSPAIASIRFGQLWSRADSQTAAYEFIVDQIDSGTTIATEVESLHNAMRGSGTRMPAYDALRWEPLHSRTVREFRAAGVKIVVLDETRAGARGGLPDGDRIRRRFEREFREIARFGGPDWPGPGPPIIVYLVPDLPPAEPAESEQQ